jgi:hypothetical protein
MREDASAVVSLKNGLPVDLTLHKVTASPVSKFVENIVSPYFCGKMNATIQDYPQSFG